MKAQLVVLSSGKWHGKPIPLPPFPFLIGRDGDCNLRPASPLIAPHHCAISFHDEHVFVRSFDGVENTCVNQQAVAGLRQLVDGDQLQVGPLIFRIEIEEPVDGKPAAPVPAGEEDDAAAFLLGDLESDSCRTERQGGDRVEVTSSALADTLPNPADTLGRKDGKHVQANPSHDKKAMDTDTSAAARSLLLRFRKKR